ncbi:MAG: DUF6152 family protein [Acidobacteriota bacterium]
MRSRKIMALVSGLVLSAVSAWAHHAFAAEFDVNKPIHFTGSVTKVELVNPHTWFHIDVKDADGKVTNWMIEAGTPNVLLRRGFTKNSVAVGTVVVVDGFQAKDGSTRGSGRDLTLPDGRKLFIGATGTEGPEEKK